jgi:hypothetical protein
MITLYTNHLLGVRPDAGGVTLRPILLEGVPQMEASLLVRGHRLRMVCRSAEPGKERGAYVGGERADPEWFPWGEEGVRLPRARSDLHVEIFC